ncbi:MAG: serine/threonine-protein kinase [Polyangiales bacterium]
MNAIGGSARRSLAPRLVGDETPTRVGRFDLVTRLGAGGMANVFLARHQGEAGFERLAAIKLLHRHLSSDEQFVQMFFDEARVAARIHHPNVVPILEIGSEHDQLYMVMDYVEGDTLAAVQRAAIGVRRAIPVGIVLRIVLDALAGLECAHDLVGPDGAPLNVVHRDVSPQNILVGLDGVSRVVDFGIARAERRLAFTTVGTLKGKAPFMSPEQLEGLAVDRRADVFSMGVTMWESFALRRLYPQRSDVETVTRANRVAYRPLRSILAHLPPAVDEIVQRALAFDVDDRFAGAGEFAEAIEDQLRADIATHRQVTTFMSAIAGEKVAAEREALRATPSTSQSRATVGVRHRYESGVHASGRTLAPGDFGVPPPPAMPDLAGLPELDSSPRGALPDLPDLDVATSVSHATGSVNPRALAPSAQSPRRRRSPSPTLAQYAQVSANDVLMEPEPLSVRPTGGGVQVVRSHIVGAASTAPRRPAAKGTPPLGVPTGLGAPPRRSEALAPRPPAPPPPPPPPVIAPTGDTGRDIEEMLQRLGADDLAPLDEAISAVSSVRMSQGSSVRQQTPAWGSGAPSSGARAAFSQARGVGMPSSVPTPAMGSVLPRSGVTKVLKGPPSTPSSATDRHAALADATGRLKPAPVEDELMQTTRLSAVREDLASPLAAIPSSDADGTQEKRLPQTFIAPPEASNAHLFSKAAAMVSLLSVAGILWLVLR